MELPGALGLPMMEMGVLEEEEELEGFMEIDGNDGIGRISCGGLQGVFSMLDLVTLNSL